MICAKDKILMEGYQAFFQGDGPEDNPYDEYLTAPHYEIWLEGYYDAADEAVDYEFEKE